MPHPAYKPAGYTSLAPYLIVPDPDATIAFARAVFDAEPLRRTTRPDGSVMHAEVRIDDTVLMMGGAMPEWPPQPTHLHVYVPDVDAAWARALAAGGEPVQEPQRKEDEDRRGGIRSACGTTWWIATQQA